MLITYWVIISSFMLLGNIKGVTALYKVGVVEHHPVEEDTPEDTILKNVDLYRSQIEKAVDRGVDIIVFPEYGLTTIHADPEKYSVQVIPGDKIIRELHDLAVEYSMYIVVNLLEKCYQEKSAVKYYNTNLVFDTDGSIIAKYRKINLLEMESKKLSPGNETVTFTTRFGVTFGLFTSFDIFFEKPAMEVLNNKKVTDVIYPTAWRSYIPFQSSLSIDNGYSVANNVTVLAAGYNDPKEGYGGSGIFTVNYVEPLIVESTDSTLIIKDLNRHRNRNLIRFKRHNENVFLKRKAMTFIPERKFQADKYVFSPINFSETPLTQEICHGKFCCTFTVRVDKSTNYISETYKLMIYSGVGELGDVTTHVHICSLLACANNFTDSCGNIINTSLNFTEIRVSSSFKMDSTSYFTPITLANNLQPLEYFTYYEDMFDGHTLNSLAPQTDVLTFGLFGRSNRRQKENIRNIQTISKSLAVINTYNVQNVITPTLILLLLSQIFVYTRLFA